MIEFDIKGYADTSLTPAIYVVQGIWCCLVFLPLAFIIRCWQRFSFTRNIRTAFTLYLSGIDSASRLIFLVYYLLRLYSIYHDGLWMIETENGDQLVTSAFSDCRSRKANFTILANIDRCINDQNTISRQNCLTFSLFLYWASTWPMTSVLLLQIHALIASTAPAKYARVSNFKFCCSTMLFAFAIDVVAGTLAYKELSDTYVRGGEPEIMDACKFEYFSRLSLVSSWHVLFLLSSIGAMTLTQLGFSYAKRRKRKHFVNPVANSPVHGWCRMTKNERVLTVAIMTCSIASFVLFIIHFIVYLVEGNSLLREILSITISVFGFFGPVELMWFNMDLRKAVFLVVFGDKPSRNGSECSRNYFGCGETQSIGVGEQIDNRQSTYGTQDGRQDESETQTETKNAEADLNTRM